MTSNEDAKIRKHVYKSLKRGSPTPLYYPLPSQPSAYAYYKAGLAGQRPVFRVLSAIGRRMAR